MANVAVTNTTGLYGLSSTTPVLNSAQQLLTLLNSNGNVDFALTTDNSQVQAFAIGGGSGSTSITLDGDVTGSGGLPGTITTTLSATGVTAGTYGSSTQVPVITVDAKGRVDTVSLVNIAAGSTYSNANVAAYLPTDPTITTIQANIGAYEIATNANLGSVFNHVNTLDANVGAYEIATNANLGSVFNHVNTLDANVGAYEIATNANLGTATTNIATLFANAATQSQQIVVVQNNLTAFETYANATFSTGGSSSYGNTNVAAYLSSGIDSSNIVTTGSFVSNSYLYANGKSILAGIDGTYGNANVAAYLPTDPTITAIQANIGGSETYANATFATQTALQVLNANVGAYETYANTRIQTLDANLGTATTNITTLFSNAATQQTQINTTTTNLQTLNANVGAFETYANATFQTASTAYGNTQVQGYLSGGWATGQNLYIGNALPASSAIIIGDNASSAQVDIKGGTETFNVGAVGGNVSLTSSFGLRLDNTDLYFNNGTGNINLNQQSGSAQGSITNANIVSAQSVVSNTGFFWSNGAAYTTSSGGGSTYSNANVAAYLVSGSVANIANITSSSSSYFNIGSYNQGGAYSQTGYGNGYVAVNSFRSYNGGTYGQVYVNVDGGITLNTSGSTNDGGGANGITLNTTNPLGINIQSSTINLKGAGGSGTTTAIVTGQLTTTGNITAQAGAYFLGDGSQLTNVAFGGNLAGRTLYDSVNQRIFANAYPLSTPSTSPVGNYFSNYVVTAPTYTNGVLQPPPAPTGQINNSSQVIGLVASGNIALQSSYQTTNNRTTAGTYTYLGVTPSTANNMTTSDRVRGTVSTLEINPLGKTWNGSQNGAQIAAGSTTMSLVGTGILQQSAASLNAMVVTPANGTANITYGTGTFSSITFSSSAGSQYQGNIQQARLFAGSLGGFSANLTALQAIGLHTTSGWAGTVGTTSGAATAYAVLNEDINTQIQTNGNVTFTSNIKFGTGQLVSYRDKVIALGTTGGSLTFDVSQAPTYTITLNSNLTGTLSGFTAGASMTVVITQDGTGGRTQSWAGVKWAGGSSTLSTAAGAIDVVNFYYDGTNYLGSLVKGYA